MSYVISFIISLCWKLRIWKDFLSKIYTVHLVNKASCVVCLWRWILFLLDRDIEFFVFRVCAWLLCIVDQQLSSHAILKFEWLACLKDKLVIPADRTRVAQQLMCLHGNMVYQVLLYTYQQHACMTALLFTSKFVWLVGASKCWLKYSSVSLFTG